MKKLLTTAALVALIASPAVAQSGKHHPMNRSATAQAHDRTDTRRPVTDPALNAYNASRTSQHGTWDQYGRRWDGTDE